MEKCLEMYTVAQRFNMVAMVHRVREFIRATEMVSLLLITQLNRMNEA
jgi:hypothetical protein